MKKNYKSNIWKYYLSKILGSLELTAAFWALFLMAKGFSMTNIMILEVIFMTLTLLLEVPSGAFADLFGRKISLFISSIAITIAFILFGIGTNFTTILIAEILMAFCYSFHSGADSAFIYDSLKEIKKEKQYSKIYGRAEFIAISTLSISSFIGVIISQFIGMKLLFFITSLFFFMWGLSVLTFNEPPIHKKLKDRNYIKHLKNAIKFTLEHKTIRNLIIYYGLFAALGHLSWFVLQPYFISQEIGFYFLGIGMLFYFFPFGIGLLLADKLIKKTRNIISPKNLLYILLLASGISFIAASLLNPIIGMIPIAIMSFTCGIRDIFISKEINIHTGSHHRATVLSIQNISKGIMYAIFAPLIGITIDFAGPSVTLMSMGIVLLIFLIIIIRLFRAIDLDMGKNFIIQ